jgi:hypothetical protein
MRVVCVCHGGNVRSVGLARILKHGDFGNHDAVAIGCTTAGRTVKELLFSWADRIVCMQPVMRETIPERYLPKVRICDVGEDVYGYPTHPDLMKKCNEWLQVDGLS